MCTMPLLVIETVTEYGSNATAVFAETSSRDERPAHSHPAARAKETI